MPRGPGRLAERVRRALLVLVECATLLLFSSVDLTVPTAAVASGSQRRFSYIIV